MACNAFVTADDENHALALIVPATLSLAGDVAMRAFYKTLGWEYASNTTDSGTVLLGYFADGESRIRNRKAITAITGTTLPAVGKMMGAEYVFGAKVRATLAQIGIPRFTGGKFFFSTCGSNCQPGN